MMNHQRLIVSEPWDFKSQWGKNLLLGEVVRRVNANTLVFELNEEVEFGDSSGKILVLSTRYVDQQFLQEPFHGVVNAGLVQGGLDYFNATSDELKINSSFIIIGHLEA